MHTIDPSRPANRRPRNPRFRRRSHSRRDLSDSWRCTGGPDNRPIVWKTEPDGVAATMWPNTMEHSAGHQPRSSAALDQRSISDGCPCEANSPIRAIEFESPHDAGNIDLDVGRDNRMGYDPQARMIGVRPRIAPRLLARMLSVLPDRGSVASHLPAVAAIYAAPTPSNGKHHDTKRCPRCFLGHVP